MRISDWSSDVCSSDLLYRPGAQTSALVVALGLALTLFVTLAGIQTSLDAEISRTVPKTAPNLFVLDIPSGQETRFRAVVGEDARNPELNIVHVLRGTIVYYGGTRAEALDDLTDRA